MFYKYKVYGLIIDSEIMMKELIPAKEDEIAEIHIRYGKVEDKNAFKMDEDKIVFNVEKVGGFEIKSGKYITVDRAEEADDHIIRTYTLGSSLGFLLSQRDIIAIHSGTVVINNKAVSITGEQGAGKSTLTTACRIKGFKVLADDVSAVSKEDGIIKIEHSYPQQKICRDAMLKLGYNPEDFIRIDEGRDKFVIPIHEDFESEKIGLGAIFEVSIGDKEHVEVEELLGSEKMNILMKNIYRIEFFGRRGIKKEYFAKILDIAKQIPMYRLKRPNNQFSVDEQIKAIEAIMAG